LRVSLAISSSLSLPLRTRKSTVEHFDLVAVRPRFERLRLATHD
jgi:hypothetical protein